MNIELIPAIDLINGRCVRLSQGDYTQQSTYAVSPLDVALRYQDIGIRRLHLIDLDGARSSRPRNLHVLEEIATRTQLDIEWGGGIKNDTAVCDAFNAGANRLIIGSIAASQPPLFSEWLQQYGPTHIILGADLKNDTIATHGWQQQSSYTIDSLIQQFLPDDLQQVICTDISRDGMLQGPAYPLYARLQQQYPDIDFTVSGGISSMDDIRQLDEMGLSAVIIGKALYEKRITLNDLEQWLQNE